MLRPSGLVALVVIFALDEGVSGVAVSRSLRSAQQGTEDGVVNKNGDSPIADNHDADVDDDDEDGASPPVAFAQQDEAFSADAVPTVQLPPRDQAVSLHGVDSDDAESEGDDMSSMGRRSDIQPPGAGNSSVVVKFGLYMKNIFELNFKEGTFLADVVFSLEWNDGRAAQLVPAGQPFVTFGLDAARKKMWLPDIAVTNRNLKGTDTISTALTITPAGLVTEVKRVVANIKNGYVVTAFPFDTQTLRVRLASTTLMEDELRLEPLVGNSSSGVAPTLMDGKDFTLEDYKVSSYIETTGMLSKSRGELMIHVKRDFGPYFQTMLFPAITLAALSWTVFVFPLEGPFAMPRLATGIISYLSLMLLSLKTEKLLPSRSGPSWIDLFMECSQVMLFTGIVLNVFVEVVFIEMKKTDIARRIQNEIRMGYPMFAVIIYVIVFSYPLFRPKMWVLFVIVRLILFVSIGGYLAVCIMRVVKKPKETPGSSGN